jgi:hypothetical protein
VNERYAMNDVCTRVEPDLYGGGIIQLKEVKSDSEKS